MEVLRIIDTYLSMHAKDQFISFVLGYLQDRKVIPYYNTVNPFIYHLLKDEPNPSLVRSPMDARVALLSGKDTASESSSSSISLPPPTPSPGKQRRGTIYSRTTTQEENALREQLKHRLKEAQTLFTYQRSWVCTSIFLFDPFSFTNFTKYNLQQTLGNTMGALLWHPSPSLVGNSMNILVRIQRNR